MADVMVVKKSHQATSDVSAFVGPFTHEGTIPEKYQIPHGSA